MSNSNVNNEEDLVDVAADPGTPSEGGLEREVLGKWTVFLRNFGGIMAVLVVCVMGLFNSYTVFISVTEHKVWPSEMSMFIMVVGPVICAWGWMNVSKIVNTVLGGAGNITKIRGRVAAIIAPPPAQNNNQQQ
ncbi:hypothetical protein D3C81_479450 [compost metagenome]